MHVARARGAIESGFTRLDRWLRSTSNAIRLATAHVLASFADHAEARALLGGAVEREHDADVRVWLGLALACNGRLDARAFEERAPTAPNDKVRELARAVVERRASAEDALGVLLDAATGCYEEAQLESIPRRSTG